MKSISNYLNAPSCIYKTVTKGAVILTNIVCILLFLVAGLSETHPVVALIITAVIASIVFLTKSRNKGDK